MICATIGRGRHSSLLEEWKAAAEAGVEMVELRIDCLRNDPDLKRILAERFTKVLFTIRRGADGGLWKGTEDKRQLLLREAIALGVDYVDLEVDVAPKIRRYGKTQRVVSYHNLKGTPQDIAEIAEQCDEMDADVVKVAARAATLSDALRVLAVTKKTAVPTIAIAMGDVGVFTRVLGAKFGAPYTYAGFNPERVFAPGMLQYHELKRDYFFDEINADTEVYAVVGDPIGHSFSPAVHNAAFRELGLNKVMVPLQIPARTLDAALKDLAWLEIQGFSVTIPHKEDLVALLDQRDGAVERTGSCNTLLVRDGKKIGYNTDYRAAMGSLESAIGDAAEDESASPLVNKTVLILGAGGVARSFAFGLSRRGAVVTIANRTDSRADDLAKEVGCQSTPWTHRATTHSDILINCTPVGMHPNVDDTPVPPTTFSRPEMVVFDTIYRPANTMMIKLARERGCKTITGADMFLGQAAAQFKLYTGQDAPIDTMRQRLAAKLGAVRE